MRENETGEFEHYVRRLIPPVVLLLVVITTLRKVDHTIQKPVPLTGNASPELSGRSTSAHFSEDLPPELKQQQIHRDVVHILVGLLAIVLVRLLVLGCSHASHRKYKKEIAIASSLLALGSILIYISPEIRPEQLYSFQELSFVVPYIAVMAPIWSWIGYKYGRVSERVARENQ